MLEIQKALRSGKTLEETCSPLGIYWKELDGKVLFNYDMIESFKNRSHPIVKECRGLILYKDNWDVACYPFSRFFNLGEPGADKLPDDLNGCLVLEKLDGTMIALYYDRVTGDWASSTRNMIYAEGPVNNLENKTFARLFWEGLKNGTNLPYLLGRDLVNTRCTYIFELTGPENRIVTPYKETKVTLLTVRDNVTLDEEAREDVVTAAKIFECDVVKTFPMTDWKALLGMDSLDPTFEGYVITKPQEHGSHLRVKCKNPGYLAISKLVTSISERGFMELIKMGKHDDMLAHFPEYRKHIEKMVNGLLKVEETVRTDWAKMPPVNMSLEEKKNRKAFAIEAYKTMFPNMLFALYDNKTCLYQLKNYIMDMRTDTLLDMVHKVTNDKSEIEKQA